MSRVCCIAWRVYCLIIGMCSCLHTALPTVPASPGGGGGGGEASGITCITFSCAGGSSPYGCGGDLNWTRKREYRNLGCSFSRCRNNGSHRSRVSSWGGCQALWGPWPPPPRLGLPPQSHHSDDLRVLGVCHRRAPLPAAAGGCDGGVRLCGLVLRLYGADVAGDGPGVDPHPEREAKKETVQSGWEWLVPKSGRWLLMEYNHLRISHNYLHDF